MEMIVDHVVFALVFMIIQYPLLISEVTPYCDAISDMRQSRFSLFNVRNILTYTLGYFILGIVLSLHRLYVSTEFVCLTALFFYAPWDVCLFISFDQGPKHWTILAYDTLMLGIVCTWVSFYIVDNYKLNVPVLVVLYFIAMGAFLYRMHVYTPIRNIHPFLISGEIK